jgi:hypothetical protein
MADSQASLEQALARLEADVDVTVRTAKNALAALKRVLGAAHTGDLKELGKTRDAAEQAIATLQQQFANVREGWDFDEEAYLSGGGYLAELVETADRAGVKIYQQDGQLYSYPFLVRVLPSERAVAIDRVRERRLRPEALVAHLKDLQTRPVRFKPEAFLEALHDAYEALAPKPEGELLPTRVRVRLAKVYELLTMLPGLAKEYTRQEFARDIYLLDQSGLTRTRNGALMILSAASTSTKSSSSVLAVITKEGQQKKYYEISFSTADPT